MLASLQSQYVVPPKNRLYRKAEPGTEYFLLHTITKRCVSVSAVLYHVFCLHLQSCSPLENSRIFAFYLDIYQL